MFAWIRQFLRAHPAVRQALIWSLPAVVFGFLLRAMLISYSPYAYWGADSESYMGFAYSLLEGKGFDLNEKRRFIYPLFLFPFSLLPGATLKWVVWAQHAFGLLTLVAFGYAIRKLFAHWRLWILPLTFLYAGMPMVIWYEHEVLAETLFFAFVVWSIAGWMAWSKAGSPVRAATLWWAFMVPFALLLLTKPAGRFFVPGIVLALLAMRVWRTLKWPHAVAGAAVLALMMTMGLSKQGAWLLYNSSFPLTRLDTPLHAEYKAEIADLVTNARENIHTYYREDASSGIKRFLKAPDKQGERPLWADLPKDKKKMTQIYTDLAKEGIFRRPDLFLGISSLRILDSSNPGDFRGRRFAPAYFSDRLDESYPNIVRKQGWIERLFGLPKGDPIPPLETVKGWVSPGTNPGVAAYFEEYVNAYNDQIVLSERPGKRSAADVTGFRLTWLGWLAAIGGVLSMVIPRFRTTLGVWIVVSLGYLFGVFLVGSANPRFFGPVWPVVILLLAVPLDGVISLLFRKKLMSDTRHNKSLNATQAPGFKEPVL